MSRGPIEALHSSSMPTQPPLYWLIHYRFTTTMTDQVYINAGYVPGQLSLSCRNFVSLQGELTTSTCVCCVIFWWRMQRVILTLATHRAWMTLLPASSLFLTRRYVSMIIVHYTYNLVSAFIGQWSLCVCVCSFYWRYVVQTVYRLQPTGVSITIWHV